MTREITVTQPSMPSLSEFIEEITPLWESRWLTNMGEKHQRLERLLIDYLRVKELSLFVNGHSALEAILKAFELKGEVITTPFSFASSTHAIVRSGLHPVFCDIKKTDGTINPKKIENLITEKTSAILPVHVYGNPCDVEAIQKIADRYKLKIVYDAAHAFGVEYKGRSLASYGDASVLSFHATKVFNTIEGGAVCHSDKSLGLKLYQQKNFGIMGPEEVVSNGGNAKMNEFSAAMGICNLRHIEEEILKRERLALIYLERLIDTPGITTCLQKAENSVLRQNYAYMPVLVDEAIYGCSRDDLFIYLASHGIHARKYFYPLISNFECYRNDIGKDSNTPVAKCFSDQVLTLPLHAGLSESDIVLICAMIHVLRSAE